MPEDSKDKSNKNRKLQYKLVTLLVVLGAPFGLYWSLNSNLVWGTYLFFILFFISLVAGGWI